MAMHRLTSIAFSHYVEKARWALGRFGVPYRERKLLPFLHFPAVYAVHRGKRGRTDRASTPYSTPVLETPEGEVLCDSAAIVRYLSDQFAPPGHELYPRDEVAALEQQLHDHLGPHARRLVYGAVFEDLSLLRDMARHNVGRVQSSLFLALLPAAVGGLRRVFAITPDNLQRSTDVVRREMQAISERLSDGRPYLLGERFTAADLAFACMAAPLLLPPEYSAWLPEPSRMPEASQALLAELRGTPAGQHAMRMFAEERSRVVRGSREESGVAVAARP